jgi:hypothetical protein
MVILRGVVAFQGYIYTIHVHILVAIFVLATFSQFQGLTRLILTSLRPYYGGKEPIMRVMYANSDAFMCNC